ncbi:MAG: Multidrug resistance protein MdtG [Chlamydiales bacterium]|nr:Multidrug resistance protein MdtG [Chlamydiales bacterium]
MKIVQKLFPIYLIIFFGNIGYSLFITIFTPLFLLHDNLLIESTVPVDRVLILGVTLFFYPFGQFLSSPILGALSDRYGRRPILLFSSYAAIVMYALIGVGIEMNSYWLVVGSLLLAGLCEGNTTIAQSAVADLTPPKDRSRLFGYIYLSVSCSFLLGPILGGKLSNPQLVSWFSYSTPFFFIALSLVVVTLWLTFSFTETHSHAKREHIHWIEAFSNIKNFFLFKKVRPLFTINLLIYLGIFGFTQGFPIYLVGTYALSVEKLAAYIAWSSIPWLAVNMFLTGYLAQRYSLAKIVIVAAVFTGLVLEIVIFPIPLRAWWIILFLAGLGSSLCLPTSSALLSSYVTPREQGRVMGINQSLQFLSEALAGILVGILASIFLKLSLLIAGGLCLLGALLLFCLLFKKKLNA